MKTITSLRQKAQLAEAAYANFSGMDSLSNKSDIERALTTGDGKFSLSQATAFTDHWRVIDQYDNTAWGGLVGTGFSATVFQNIDTGDYSFAIRGSLDAADFIADAKLITTDGIAVQQLVDLYNYWTSLTSGPNAYQAAMLSTQFTATGFLRTLYAGSVAQVPDTLRTLFGGVNSVDFYDVARAVFLANGYIVEGGTVYQLEWGDSQSVLPGSHITVGLNKLPSGASVSVAGHSLGGHLAMAFSRLFPNTTVDVTAINGLGFNVNDANVNNLFAQLHGAPGFDAGKVQNIYGIEGYEFAAMNNGVLQQPGQWDGIYIESAGLGTVGGHSASQMTDSLAVYDLFAKVDENLTLAAITGILQVSDDTASESLESAVSALGELLVPTFMARTGSEYDTDRNALYTDLQAIAAAVEASIGPGLTQDLLTVHPLMELGREQTASRALSNSVEGLGFRYALVYANPFAITGDASLYDVHNLHHELDLFDSETGQGRLTSDYLNDRAAFVLAQINFNLNGTQTHAPEAIEYHDITSTVVITETTTNSADITRRIVFGSEGNDVLDQGGRLADAFQ